MSETPSPSRPPRSLTRPGRPSVVPPRFRRRERSFSIGDAMGTTMEIWIKNFFPLFVLSFVVTAPALLLVSVLDERYGAVEANSQYQWSWVSIAEHGINQLVVGLLSAIVIGGVSNRLRRRSAGLFQNLGASLARVPTAIGTTLLVAAMMALCIVPALLLALTGSDASMVAGLVVGLLGLFVVVSARFVAVPATVVESISPLASVRRSIRLTAGSRWAIVGLLILVWLLTSLIGIAFFMLIPFALSTSALEFVTYGFAAAIMPSSAVMSAVVYRDLRVASGWI